MADATTTQQLHELQRLVQERLGLTVAAVALAEWEGVNLAAPSLGGPAGWFVRLLRVILERRRLSHAVALRYHNLIRAIETRIAWDNPFGDPYGPTVLLSELWSEFENLVNDVNVLAGIDPDTPSSPSPTDTGAPIEGSEGDSLDVDIEALTDAIEAELARLRPEFPNEELEVEPADWPEFVDDDEELELLVQQEMQDELDRLDRLIEQAERDEAAEAAEIRSRMRDLGELSGDTVAALADTATIQAGRDALVDAINKDTRVTRWARITAANPCAFCAMLASRGAVYKTEQSAAFGKDEPHKRCHCQPVAYFMDNPVELPELAQWFKDHWEEGSTAFPPRRRTKQARGSQMTSNDLLNSWRTWLSRQFREGLVPTGE